MLTNRMTAHFTSKLTHPAYAICQSKVAVLLCSKTETKRLPQIYESDI